MVTDGRAELGMDSVSDTLDQEVLIKRIGFLNSSQLTVAKMMMEPPAMRQHQLQ